MSPKPVDVRRALETLRAERPDPEAAERARRALRRSAPRRNLTRPLTALMITAALVVVVFTPRAHAGSAWAQTLAATLDAPASHAVDRWPDGKLAMEEWRFGVKRATVLYNREGKAMIEMRSDGQRRLNYASLFDFMRFEHERIAPNAREWATVSKDSTNPQAWYETPLGTLRNALTNPDIKVIAHHEATESSTETYRLQRTIRLGGKAIGKPHTFTVEIDPASGRIRAIVEDPRLVKGKPENARTQIDYPSSIPASVFEPKPQAAKGVQVLDNDVDKVVQRNLRQGIAKRGPVTLRAVVLTGDGDLWAFWTGALPAPELPHPFSIPGMKCGPAFTNRIYTTDWRHSPKTNGVPVATSGPRLGGMGRTPLAKLGPTVDLDVPYPGGVAHFRGVPYVRTGYINYVSSVLGAKRDYR